MTLAAKIDAYGALTAPDTLTIERLLPGPVERIWAYLTESNRRRQWFAAGDMTLTPGAPFELVWRNDELTDPPGQRPAGFPDEHRMQSRIVEVDPPFRLTFAFGEHGEVTFQLEPQGEDVLLTLIHRRAPDRATLLKVAAGWHMHLDVLTARASGTEPAPFWDGLTRLRAEYERRIATQA